MTPTDFLTGLVANRGITRAAAQVAADIKAKTVEGGILNGR